MSSRDPQDLSAAPARIPAIMGKPPNAGLGLSFVTREVIFDELGTSQVELQT